MSGSILLSNGARFDNAEARIREYCEVEVYRDIGYRGGYDDHHNVSDIVSREDIEAANNLYAYLDSLDRERILRNPRIPSLLATVKDVDLGSLTDEDWEGVKALVSPLFSEFLSIPNVKLAKATKILHLKRPHLFPILDSFVVKFLSGNDTTNLYSVDEWLQIGLSALETVRADIVRNRDAFGELQGRLSDLPSPLTIVRLYDILCWTQEKWVNQSNPSAKYGTARKSLDQTVHQTEDTLSIGSTPAIDVGKHPQKPPPPGEITSIKEFRRVVARAEGIIVITGTTPPRAHSPLCNLLTDDRFNQNVNLDGGKSGRYYWRSSLVEARKEFGAVACKRCRAGGATPSIFKL